MARPSDPLPISLPASRASQAREALNGEVVKMQLRETLTAVWEHHATELDDVTGQLHACGDRLAEYAKRSLDDFDGCIVLTADEVEQVRHELLARRVDLGSHLEYDTQPRRLNREALALLSGGAGEATPA